MWTSTRLLSSSLNRAQSTCLKCAQYFSYITNKWHRSAVWLSKLFGVFNSILNQHFIVDIHLFFVFYCGHLSTVQMLVHASTVWSNVSEHLRCHMLLRNISGLKIIHILIKLAWLGLVYSSSRATSHSSRQLIGEPAEMVDLRPLRRLCGGHHFAL